MTALPTDFELLQLFVTGLAAFLGSQLLLGLIWPSPQRVPVQQENER